MLQCSYYSSDCQRINLKNVIKLMIFFFFLYNKPTKNYNEGLDESRRKVWEALPVDSSVIDVGHVNR